MHRTERNGKSKLEQKLLTPASQDNGIKIDVVVYDINISAVELNNDLQKIPEWDFNWKIFNPDLNKQVQEVILGNSLNKPSYPIIVLNIALVA